MTFPRSGAMVSSVITYSLPFPNGWSSHEPASLSHPCSRIVRVGRIGFGRHSGRGDGRTRGSILVQAFPPNTGVGWYTLATGTWPSEHGSTNNTFHRTGEASFNNSTSFATTGILQADTLAASAERAGKKVAQVEWAGGANAGIAGPTVDFVNFFSTRGVLTMPAVPAEQSGAAAFGIS